jgi:hypothetical protein
MFILFYFANNAANAIEYNFVCEVSPRDDNTHGTLAPITTAATSAWLNLLLHL